MQYMCFPPISPHLEGQGKLLCADGSVGLVMGITKCTESRGHRANMPECLLLECSSGFRLKCFICEAIPALAMDLKEKKRKHLASLARRSDKHVCCSYVTAAAAVTPGRLECFTHALPTFCLDLSLRVPVSV